MILNTVRSHIYLVLVNFKIARALVASVPKSPYDTNIIDLLK